MDCFSKGFLDIKVLGDLIERVANLTNVTTQQMLLLLEHNSKIRSMENMYASKFHNLMKN